MKYLPVYILLFLILGCQDIKEVEKPERLIDEKEMVAILKDLTIYSAAKGQDRRLLESKNVDMVHILQKKYKIDTIVLKQNIAYYTADLEKYQAMHEEVKRQLEEEKKKYDAVNARKKEENKKKFEARQNLKIEQDKNKVNEKTNLSNLRDLQKSAKNN